MVASKTIGGLDKRVECVCLFKDKVPYSGKAFHSSLKVVGDSHVISGENGCFCGTVGCMKGVVSLVQNVTFRVPEFL